MTKTAFSVAGAAEDAVFMFFLKMIDLAPVGQVKVHQKGTHRLSLTRNYGVGLQGLFSVIINM